jgi:membrane carboxypeptidase/penicillin-binding protein
VAEAAMLAGLIKAPSEYNPIRNLEAAHQRAAQVLDAMAKTGATDAKTAAEAKAAPAEVKAAAEFAPATSWFADWIAKHEFRKVAGADRRSIKVRTTLVPELQQAAERVIAEALEVPRRGGPSQAALVAMRPDGAVVAMVGGRDYDQSRGVSRNVVVVTEPALNEGIVPVWRFSHDHNTAWAVNALVEEWVGPTPVVLPVDQSCISTQGTRPCFFAI